jgi:hypothetical protein
MKMRNKKLGIRNEKVEVANGNLPSLLQRSYSIQSAIFSFLIPNFLFLIFIRTIQFYFVRDSARTSKAVQIRTLPKMGR